MSEKLSEANSVKCEAQVSINSREKNGSWSQYSVAEYSVVAHYILFLFLYESCAVATHTIVLCFMS